MGRCCCCGTAPRRHRCGATGSTPRRRWRRAVVCWMVSRQAGSFGKRVWRLVAFSLPAYRRRPGSLHRLLRLSARASGHAVAERCPGLLLDCAGRDDAVSESEGPRQRIRVVARLRFCAGLHPRAGRRIVADLRAFALASWQVSAMQVRTLHAGIFFFGLIALSFLVRGLLSLHRTERAFFLRLGGIPDCPRDCSQCDSLPIRLPVTTAGSMDRPSLDLELLLAHRDCGNME